MQIKNGAMHIQSLKDGRTLYLDGKPVVDHTSHPAFRNAVASAARLYDYQAEDQHQEAMTYQPPGVAKRVSRIWQLPSTLAGLVERRRALTAWAELSGGMLGRSPDHVASALAGMYMGADVFDACDAARAAALRGYYEYARNEDLYLSYAIVSPQAVRSKDMVESGREFLACGVCDEDAKGITLKGAKMIATAVPLANELMVGSIQPLRPGEEKYSVTAMVPLNAPGLKLLSRRSYEASASSEFDYPLSSRFDENDCIVYFDEVRVPWDRVFVHNNVKMASDQWHATPAHVYQNYQCQIRLMVKLNFLLGLARKISEINGIQQFPAVRETLGHLSAQVSMAESMVYAMESQGTRHLDYWIPNRQILYAAQVLTQQLYPDFIRALRELAGGGLIMLPSSEEDMLDPVTRALIEKVQHSPVTDAVGRVKLMKLAWDAIGSEFGSRHLQYEMFYAGAPMVTRQHAFRTFDWDYGTQLVDRILAGDSLTAHRSSRPPMPS